MPSYDELKTELVRIAELLTKFPDELHSKVYDLLIAEFLGKAPAGTAQVNTPGTGDPTATPRPAPKAKPKAPVTVSTETPSSARPKRSASKETYSIDRSLNLRGDGSIPSFTDFYAEKAPKGAKEFNAVAVYYLSKILGLSPVTLNHAYTCYTEVKEKPPKAFRQSFIDAKNKSGWLEFDESGNLLIPHRGSVFVEHDLPHPVRMKK